MGLSAIVWIVLGGGGLAALVIGVIEIRKWGAERYKRKDAERRAEVSDEAAERAQEQRKIANSPRLRGNALLGGLRKLGRGKKTG